MAVFLSEEYAAPSDPADMTTTIARRVGSTDEAMMTHDAARRDPLRRKEKPLRRIEFHDDVRMNREAYG